MQIKLVGIILHIFDTEMYIQTGFLMEEEGWLSMIIVEGPTLRQQLLSELEVYNKL